MNVYEKENFINIFKEMTGFPDFFEVKNKINNEAINGITNLGQEQGFKTLYAGYCNACSLGKNLPLPGSDADGLVFLIEDNVNGAPYYRWQLKDKINQRILETPVDHLPEIIPVKQAKKFIELAEQTFKKQKFSHRELKKYEQALCEFNPDYLKAADFNSKIIKGINLDETNINEIEQYQHVGPSIQDKKKQFKYDFLATCLMLENYRQHTDNTLINNLDKDTKKLFENSCLYKYSNITQQKALLSLNKDKLLEREKVIKQLNSYDTEDQFELIKAIIYNSFEIKPEKENPHYKLFVNEGSHTIGLDSLVQMYENLTTIN